MLRNDECLNIAQKCNDHLNEYQRLKRIYVINASNTIFYSCKNKILVDLWGGKAWKQIITQPENISHDLQSSMPLKWQCQP